MQGCHAAAEEVVGLSALVAALDRALAKAGNAPAQAVADTLATHVTRGELQLPPAFSHTRAEQHMRRQIHHSTSLGYCIVVMSWAAGQGTPIHDHGGAWCSDCLIEGQLQTTLFRIAGQDGSHYRLTQYAQRQASLPGSHEALHSDAELHAVCNPGQQTAISLHVYQQPLHACGVYLPDPARPGHYLRESLSLQLEAQT